MWSFLRRRLTGPMQEEAAAPLTGQQKRQIVAEFERHAGDDGNDVDGAIAMLRMGMDEVLPGFARALQKATVGVMVEDPQRLESALVLNSTDGIPHFAVFTRLEHATALKEKFPQHRYVVFVEMRHLCGGVHGEIGLVINPEHETFRFVFSPEQFAAFRKFCLGQGEDR